VPPDEGQPFEAGAFGPSERAFNTLPCIPQTHSRESGKSLLFLHKNALKSFVSHFSVLCKKDWWLYRGS
jgi:hypothetical protein